MSQPDLPSTAEPSSLEGEGETRGIGAYPLDNLLIRTDQRTVHDLLRREQQGFLILDPEFQRAFVWEPERQSRLIESVLMRIPLPVFYLAENSEGKLVVVDGLQRISSLKRFVSDEQKLVLENPELHGKKFSELPPKLRNRIEDAQLTLYVIDSKAPERVRLDIFERVNSGRPLSRQQMRNALYQGPATRFLREIVDEADFVTATGGSLNPLEMRDREAVNRFVAFSLLGVASYGDDMDDFLAAGLRKLNSSSEAEHAELRERFLRSMRLNYRVYERHAFRKHRPGQPNRSVLNLSLFDAFSVAFASVPEERVAASSARLRDGFFKLMESDDFMRAITLGTSGKQQVTSRFALVEKMVAEAVR